MKTTDFIIDVRAKDKSKKGTLEKIKSGIAGARAGWKASQLKRQAEEMDTEMANILYKEWNEELVKYPGIQPDEIPQLIVNFLKKKFKDRPQIKYPELTSTSDKAIYDYLRDRLKEYYRVAGVEPQEPVTQLKVGYSNPKTDITIELLGNEYFFRADTGKWYDESGQVITNNRDIQTLNRKYYDFSRGGRFSTPNDDDTPPSSTPGGKSRPPKTNKSDGGKQSTLSLVTPPDKGDNTDSGNITKVAEDGLFEGGNAIASSEPVNKEDVPTVVDIARRQLPKELLKNLAVDIGSAGFKTVPAGDIDLMIEASDLIELFKTHSDPKDSTLAAKKSLEEYFRAKGIDANTKGRNVHIGIPYKQKSTNQVKIAQVDVMVIDDVKMVAPWHQHGPRGMYSDPEFVGNAIFILISSIAKPLGLKFDPFSAKLIDRQTGKVVARTRDQVAKVLFNPVPKEKGDALNSVKSIMKALDKDPDREIKLAQARDDANKGVIKLPESIDPGSPAWFRKLSTLV